MKIAVCASRQIDAKHLISMISNINCCIQIFALFLVVLYKENINSPCHELIKSVCILTFSLLTH